MSLKIIQCGKITCSRTISNGSRRRTTRCSTARKRITRRVRSWTVRKKSLQNRNDCDARDSRSNGATTDNHDLATRGRVARSVDGTAASVDPRRFSNERRARGRDRPQTEAGVWLFASQPRTNWRAHDLSWLDAIHRSARLLLLNDEQLGLR